MLAWRKGHGLGVFTSKAHGKLYDSMDVGLRRSSTDHNIFVSEIA